MGVAFTNKKARRCCGAFTAGVTVNEQSGGIYERYVEVRQSLRRGRDKTTFTRVTVPRAGLFVFRLQDYAFTC